VSPDLEAAVLAILRAHPDGISEFAMFAELARGGFAEFEREVFADRMKMFRSHFVLFHVLYVIREELVMRREGHLTIEVMRIHLRPWASPDPNAEATLTEHDPLRDYYLDPSNCDAMTDEELRAMLDRFWERFAAHDGRGDALRVLGLEPGASWDEVKSRHRALVFEHHPDRGGDAVQLAAINAAMRVLEVSKP
jgi:DnaJ-domain-containing protein 1